jgi:hypothetical protein
MSSEELRRSGAPRGTGRRRPIGVRVALGIMNAIRRPRRFDKDWQLLLATRSWLSERGYKLVETRAPEATDQALLRYAGDYLALRIAAYRGHWFVEVKTAHDWSDWHTLKIWSACLGAHASFHDPRLMTSKGSEKTLSYLASQLDYLRDHLTEIEAACQPDRVETTLKCVSAAEFEARWARTGWNAFGT